MSAGEYSVRVKVGRETREVSVSGANERDALGAALVELVEWIQGAPKDTRCSAECAGSVLAFYPDEVAGSREVGRGVPLNHPSRLGLGGKRWLVPSRVGDAELEEMSRALGIPLDDARRCPDGSRTRITPGNGTRPFDIFQGQCWPYGEKHCREYSEDQFKQKQKQYKARKKQMVRKREEWEREQRRAAHDRAMARRYLPRTQPGEEF